MAKRKVFLLMGKQILNNLCSTTSLMLFAVIVDERHGNCKGEKCNRDV